MLKEFFDQKIVDLKKGLTTFPDASGWRFSIVITLCYLVLSLAIIKSSSILLWTPRKNGFNLALLLYIVIILYNAFVEEIIFRGILIPPKYRNVPQKKSYLSAIFSISIFVAWHPITALFFSHPKRHLFLDPAILCIVTLLAMACSITYLRTSSLWMPIIIHWITIIVWVLGFGG